MVVQISKVDNGYTLNLQEQLPREPVVPDFQNPFEGMDPDEIVDKMINGMGAVIRTINDKGAGESWKDDEDRQAVREAFKVMFPGLARSIRPPRMPKVPRYEDRVFESKETLLKYLTENL